MTNANHKAAIRERMAATGENYTTAKRAIGQVLRDGAPKPQNPGKTPENRTDQADK